MVTLTGINFGDERGESYVTIAGVPPTNSSYLSWQDNRIIVRIPELGESGLVYVHTRGRKSNGVLFSNTASVPRPLEGEEMGFVPRIVAVNPQQGVPGTLITITGNNFGLSRESSSGVFFTWDFDSAVNPYVVREPEFIEVSEIELGYDFWSAREIRVRLPDGAVSGNFEVRTPHGSSRPAFFDVSGRPGTKSFKDKRSYTITYSVDIRVQDASRPNTLYLWMPLPVNSPSQRNVTLISRSTDPFIANHRGVSLFKLDNLGTGTIQNINLSFSVEVYSVESQIRPGTAIRQERTPLAALYTQSTPLITTTYQPLRTTVTSIIGREQNPHTRARLLYDWFLTNIQISNTAFNDTAVQAIFDRRRADPYSAALLYTAMARAAGVPCIPVAGVFIDRHGQTYNHFWAEFWVDGLGWLPVDPAMGASGLQNNDMPIESTMSARELANFYFGNIDNHRIAFSRGETALSQMESRGRIVTRNQSYSLQNIWEEAAGGLESYSSLWSNIIVTGTY